MARTIPLPHANCANFWDENLAGRRIILVYAAMRDKAVDEIAGMLFPRAGAVILTQPHQVPRHLGRMCSREIDLPPRRKCESIADASLAIDRALLLANGEDCAVFITGSLFLVGRGAIPVRSENYEKRTLTLRAALRAAFKDSTLIDYLIPCHIVETAALATPLSGTGTIDNRLIRFRGRAVPTYAIHIQMRFNYLRAFVQS